jgi:hypothetical protein
MNVFTHYSGCKGDLDNCSACALLSADRRGPNYAGWPLVYMQSGRRIPQRYFDALLKELDRTDNVLYVQNLLKHLSEHGYNIEVIRRLRHE